MSTLTVKQQSKDLYSHTNDYINTNDKDSIDYLVSWSKKGFEQNRLLYFHDPHIGALRTENKFNFLKKTGSFRKERLRREGSTITVNKINYFLPSQLNEISEEVETSREILDFKEGWDGADAQPVYKHIYDEGIKFLLDYSLFIFNNSNIIIDTPEINPGRNGNLYLSWRTEHARLAISIEENKNEDLIASYYGDLNFEKSSIKGTLPVGEVTEFFATWMKNLI